MLRPSWQHRRTICLFRHSERSEESLFDFGGTLTKLGEEAKWAAGTHTSKKSNTNPQRRNSKSHFFPAARPSKSTRRKFPTATTASRAAFSTFPKYSSLPSTPPVTASAPAQPATPPCG